MFEKLIETDQQWLIAINQCNAPWADTLMWWASGKLTWLPLYALLVGLLFWRFGWRRALLMLVGFGVAIGLADYISSGIIKHAVCRWRPTHQEGVENLLHIVRGYRGGNYGFVSSHAANTMACALLFSLLWGKDRGTGTEEQGQKRKGKENILISHCSLLFSVLFAWVALNCYSRMYLGVHYPGDIVGGLLVGSLTAIGVYYLLGWLERLLHLVDAPDHAAAHP